MVAKARRQQHILDILGQQSVPNQDRLQNLLASRGVAVTQATLSRDLRDLNVLKGPSGYVTGGSAPEPAGASAQLQSALRLYTLTMTPAASLLVLRTRPGNASALAAELDRAGLPGIAGTIAGDDTVFLAANSPARAKTLHRTLRHLIDRP